MEKAKLVEMVSHTLSQINNRRFFMKQLLYLLSWFRDGFLSWGFPVKKGEPAIKLDYGYI